jgi:hypothetical protein
MSRRASQENATPATDAEAETPREHHEPHVTKETVQRVAPTATSRREFSIKGLPLDHAQQGTHEVDVEAKPVEIDDDDINAAVGQEDLGGAAPKDGLPPPLQYHGNGFKALWIDLKRKSMHYRTDWTDAFLPQNISVVLSASLFMFFACLAPALAFGAIYEGMSGGQVRLA